MMFLKWIFGLQTRSSAAYKGINIDMLKDYTTSHILNYEYLCTDDFDKFITD